MSREHIRTRIPTLYSKSRISHLLASFQAPPAHRLCRQPSCTNTQFPRDAALTIAQDKKRSGRAANYHRRWTYTLHTLRATGTRHACRLTRKREERGKKRALMLTGRNIRETASPISTDGATSGGGYGVREETACREAMLRIWCENGV